MATVTTGIDSDFFEIILLKLLFLLLIPCPTNQVTVGAAGAAGLVC